MPGGSQGEQIPPRMVSLSSMSRSPKITVLSLVTMVRSTNWGPRCLSTQENCVGGTGLSVGPRGPRIQASEEAV